MLNMNSPSKEASLNIDTIDTAEVRGQFLDHDLAIVLQRLAALQGHAVPAHRFGMMSVTSAGSIENLARDVRAIELWLSALPGGVANEINGLPERTELPAIWFSADGNQVRLLRGTLSNGGFSSETPEGKTEELTHAQALAGRALLLHTQQDATSDRNGKPQSARDWFYYSIKKRRWMFIEAVFATFMVSVLALVAGFYTMQVYDRVVPTQSYSTLTVLTVGALLAIGLELLLKQVRANIVDRANKAIDQELSGVFFGRVLDIRMDARPRTVGTFAGQVKQFELVRNFMTSSTLFLLADTPFVIFFIGIIAMIGGVVAWVPIALLPVSILVGFYARWRISKAAEEQLNDINLKNGVLVEAIDGIEAIKAAGGEWKLLDRWQQLTAETSERELRVRSTSMIATNLGQTIQQLSYIFLIATGVYAINSGQLTMGGLIACSIISNRALSPISQIAGMIVQWQHAKAALKGLDIMMALPTDRSEDVQMVIPEKCRGQIKLDQATFSYSDTAVALHPTNLIIQPGARIAIIGPVGSGKSTLIKLLSGLYKPTAGRAFLDGVDMTHIAPEYLRENVGYLTQDVRLFSGTLRENVTLGLPSPTDSQILAAAAKTGLDRMITEHPKGLDRAITEGGRGLSGGQRQVVGLTRLLLAKPRVLLLDEPTASMDSDLEGFVMKNLFGSLPEDAVVILATHKRGLLKLVDRVIIVDQHRIVVDGKRDEVLSKMASVRQRLAAPSEPIKDSAVKGA